MKAWNGNAILEFGIILRSISLESDLAGKIQKLKLFPLLPFKCQ